MVNGGAADITNNVGYVEFSGKTDLNPVPLAEWTRQTTQGASRPQSRCVYDQWLTWRTWNVTDVAARASAAARKANPNIHITTAVFSDYSRSRAC